MSLTPLRVTPLGVAALFGVPTLLSIAPYPFWENVAVRLLMVMTPFENTVKPLVKLELKVLVPLKVTPAVDPPRLFFRKAPSPAVLPLTVRLAMVIAPSVSMYNPCAPPLELILFIPLSVTPAGEAAVELLRYTPVCPLFSAVTLLAAIKPLERIAIPTP